MKKILRLICVALMFAGIFAFMPAGAEAQENETILSGIYIEEIDLSGLSKSEAYQACMNRLEELKLCVVYLSDENGVVAEVPAGEFGLDWDNPQIVDEALSLGRKGNAVARYKERKDIEHNGVVYNMELIVDEALVAQIVEEKCVGVGTQAVNPTLVRENGEFIIKDGQTGIAVDREATSKAICDALLANRSTDTVDVELVTTISDPAAKKEDLAKVKDLLGTFTTSYSSSNAARSGNVVNGTSLINGTVLFPGEEFSTYNAVKPFTTENGYFMAGSYLNGMVVDSMGGGICQVSTTLYNAVIRAELEITQRHSHSMVVTYVKVSEDAAIAESSGKDFTFVNNYDYPIYIEGITGPDKKVTFNIYGVETRPEGRTVEFENEIIQTLTPETERIIADASQGIGYVKIQSAHIGYKARLWKIVKENGVEVSREQVNSSSYSMSPRTAVVGINTANPQRLAEIQAAIGTANIDHVRGVAAALYAQEVAEAAGQPPQ